MDRILKLVYSSWYYQSGIYKIPIPNGVHPVLVKHIQDCSIENKFLVEVQQSIQLENDNMVFVHDHNNFIGYHRKYYDESTIVDVKDIINDNSIYLYPIEIRTNLNSLHSKMNFKFKSETYEYVFADTIPNDVLALLKNGTVKLLINYVHEPLTVNDQISEIENSLNQLGIDSNNIIILAGNKFSSLTSKIKFTEGGIIMGQQMALDMDFYPRQTGLGYISDIVRQSDLDHLKIRNKKFLCFNRTLKSHRFMIAYIALKYNLLAENIFSFINPLGMQASDIYHRLLSYVDDDSNLKEIATAIHNLIPYEIDTKHLSTNQKTNFGNENNKKELYLDTYLHIVSETGFDAGDYPFLSEKTYRPIINLQPFIYIGNYHSLAKLHEMGFKTFHPYINEDYDLEKNPKKRMSMIEKEISIFNNKSLNEIHHWYYSIIDILLYNQAHLNSIKNINPFEKAYSDIKEMYE